MSIFPVISSSGSLLQTVAKSMVSKLSLERQRNEPKISRFECAHLLVLNLEISNCTL